MTGRVISIEPLTAEAFAPFGEVLEVAGAPDKIINQGQCGRHHDLAALDFADGRAGISLFNAEPRSLPYTFDLLERHPDGSQAFIPLDRTGSFRGNRPYRGRRQPSGALVQGPVHHHAMTPDPG